MKTAKVKKLKNRLADYKELIGDLENEITILESKNAKLNRDYNQLFDSFKVGMEAYHQITDTSYRMIIED